MKRLIVVGLLLLTLSASAGCSALSPRERTGGMGLLSGAAFGGLVAGPIGAAVGGMAGLVGGVVYHEHEEMKKQK